MPNALSPDDRAAIERVVGQLEAAWNAMDGAAFAAPFADDADFVNVRGDHAHGRGAIEAGHAGIFRSIYAGSTNEYVVEDVRLLRPDVALTRVRARLRVPQGPLAGEYDARYSAVLTREPNGWQVASFHNTFIAPPGPPR